MANGIVGQATGPLLTAGHDTAGFIAFDSGHAFPGILPDLRDAAGVALGRYRSEALQYGERPGLASLRDWIAQHMNGDGARITADNILVVNGAKHGIELICRALLQPGDSIVVTAPTYFTAIPIFRGVGATFVEIGQDAEGIDTAELEDRLGEIRRAGQKPPKLIYNIPDFHNPTGVTMSRKRREALVDIGRRHGIFLLEDSPYREIRFAGTPAPTLKSLDEDQHVLVVGTFSKLLAPGLRIGWVVAPREMRDRLAQMKSDGGSSPLLQRTILEFLGAGRFADHIALACRTYRSHRDAMREVLARHLPQATASVPDGGYYLWLALPANVDADVLAVRAQREGVGIIPGSKFYASDIRPPRNDGHPRNTLRLAYSHASPDEIEEGVKRLARAVQPLLAG